MANKKFKDGNTLDSTQVWDDGNNNTLDNILESMKFTNYLSQCTLINCKDVTGGIYKCGKLVIVQIHLTSTTTNGWAILLTVPPIIYPASIYDNGIPLLSSEAWLYGAGAYNGAGNIRRSVEIDKGYDICGVYISAN